MGSQSIRMVFMVLCSTVCYANAPTTLLESSLNDFIVDVVKQEDQKSFYEYFEATRMDLKRQFDRLSRMQNPVKKMKRNQFLKAKLAHIEQQGRMACEVKNPALAADIKKTLCSKHPSMEQEKKIRRFWYKMGVLEDYLQRKLAEQKSILTKTKCYMRDASNKVISWASSLRSRTGTVS